MNCSRSNFTPFVYINFLSIIILALFLSNCAPSVSLKNIKEPRTSKPADCELITYSRSGVLPSSAEVLGEISIKDTGFSIQCDEAEIDALAREQACRLGADGIQIFQVLPPDMSSTCYRIKARAIGLPSGYFESSRLSKENIVAYLDSSAVDLDPIEGIWTDTENKYQIAVIRDNESPKRDFKGIVLRSRFSNWKQGNLKIELERTAVDGIYMANYFTQNKSDQGTTVFLKNDSLFSLKIVVNVFGLKEEMLFVKNYPNIGDVTTKESERTGESTGTGFFVSSDGYLLTAQHVIDGAKNITVVLPSGVKKEAVVVKSSKSIDVALLKIETSDAKPLSLINPGRASAGDPVYTFGYPVVSVLGVESKYTDGSISSLSGIQDDATFMQITVPVQPGNSGGALANENGDVVGLITSTAASLPFLKATGNLPQNINWAVNADFIRPFMPTQSTASKTRSKKEGVKAVKNATCLIVTTR